MRYDICHLGYISNNMDSAAKIRVLLVDDHPLVRRTLRTVLLSHPNIEIVGEAADGDEAITSAKSLKPDVVLMDIAMRKMDGVTAARLIKTEYPHVAIVGLSADPKGYNVYAMKKAGAFEVFTKEDAYKDLHAVIERAAAAKKVVLTWEAARRDSI